MHDPLAEALTFVTGILSDSQGDPDRAGLPLPVARFEVPCSQTAIGSKPDPTVCRPNRRRSQPHPRNDVGSGYALRIADYVLRPKSGTWAGGQLSGRLLRFDMTVSCDGKPLGGNNIQVVLGAADQHRTGHDEQVVLWLDSGWWVTLRNEFERAPDIARQIVGNITAELSAITNDPGGAEAAVVFASVFETCGPDRWRP